MSWKARDSLVVALFNWVGNGSSGQLSLAVGDLIYVMEECSGWLRGYLYYEPSKIGVFPASFVETKETLTPSKEKDSLFKPTKSSIIPVAMETTLALREWRFKLVEFYKDGKTERFRWLLHAMEDVMSQRANIIHSTATLDVLQSMNTKLTARIDGINSELKCPLTPRDNGGAPVNCKDTSAQQLYQIHCDRRAELEARIGQTGGLKKRAETDVHSSLPHLFVQINRVDHSFPEQCEIYMFLYEKDGRGQMSERFFMSSHSRSNVKPSALFTDLSAKDIQSKNIFLVCQIIRRGKMLLDDKKNISQSPFRRPYGTGILELDSVLQMAEDRESYQNEDLITHNLPLYLCSANHESDFSTFHDKIVVKFGAKGGQKPGCSILLSMRMYRGELAQLQRDLAVTSTLSVVHKLGFPDIILPGDVRNDIYVKLECGQFEKGSKRAERNVEVAVEVVDGVGKTIPRSIILGAGAPPTGEYESLIFYHNNYPRWNESFKLSIPFEKLPDTHLRIAFRHVAKNEGKDKAEKTFAFTYLKIMNDDGSIIKDGLHELYVYKADSNKRWYDPKVYLNQLSRKEDITRTRGTRTMGGKLSVSDASYTGSSMVARSFKEYIQISTLTCSTKLTQKIELLKLLKWRQKQDDLSVVLTNLTVVDGEEAVKFLQDILDCLFDILDSNQDIYGEKVFEVMVFIFHLLLDQRYQHFSTVLDIYIRQHFSAMLSHRFMVLVFDRAIRECANVTDQHPRLIKILRTMKYIFKFMAQSHVLYARHNKRDDEEFKAELRQVFSALSHLMGHQENRIKNISTIQIAVLRSLPQVLPEVVQILSIKELVSLFSVFLKSVRNSHSSIPPEKLRFIQTILDSPVQLLESKETRRILLPTFVAALADHMDSMPRTNFKSGDEANGACMACVGELIAKLAELKAESCDIDHMIPLLFPVLRLCRQIPKNNQLYGQNSINLIGLLDLMRNTHYTTFFNTQKEMYGNDLKETLLDFMYTLKGVINGHLFPRTWVSMYLMQNRVISRTLSNISAALCDNFLRAISFTPQVWDHYFSLCTEFIVQPSLQLDQHQSFRQLSYLEQFGDMRQSMSDHVMSMWHRLGDQKGNFIPDLIGPFLELSLVKQHQVRKTALPVVFDIMSCEQVASGNFKRVETEVFDKMDDLLFKGRGDEEYQELFSEILTLECSQSQSLSSTGPPFIDSVARLIGMLLDYRIVSADESGQGRKMGCMLNLLNFYKEIEKHELYVRYIYKLAELHEKNHSYTEAGFTLLLHAGELEWTSDPEAKVAAVGRYPDQTSLQRKEQLYMDAVRLFNDGKSWECGVPLCKELATLYETSLFDYPKLASILKKQAMFHERIIDLLELRVAPEYFMVGYYGRGFPLFLRNKVFVHRGQPYEKLTSFIKRLTDEFTTAQILKTVTPPDNDIQNSSGMHLQVRSVNAIPEDRPEFANKQVPDRIIEYYKSNEVQRFTYDRPFHNGKKNKECEFASLWIERTTFTTVKKFPGVISWFEVSSTNTVELNPLDIALETVTSKNSEIQVMVDQYKANPVLNINPLSMTLNGVIDAAVMGGVANYDKIFFNSEYSTTHPDHVDGVKQLRALIEDQTKVLAQGLLLHGQRIDPSLRGLHEKLESCFEEFQCIVYPERKAARMPAVTVSRSKTMARPLPPAPLLGGSPPAGTGSNLKRPARRATGKPNRIPRPPSESIYEDADFTKQSVSSVRRSVSSVARSPAPSVPPPRLGGSPSAAKKRLSASMSSGGSSEQLDRVNERSSVISTDSADGITDYEPIQDFLISTNPAAEDSSRSYDPRASIISEAPSYPAPVPPSEGEVDDDDGYTKVSITSGEVQSPFVSNPEWAELPLRPVKQRAASKPPSSGHVTSSSPNKSEGTTIETKRGSLKVPPQPDTPPPSPPTDHVTSPESPEATEQPKLPPKKLKQKQSIEQPQQDTVYFDHLVGPPPNSAPSQQAPPLKPKQKPPIEQPQQDSVYFDHLVGPPPSTTPPPKEAPPPISDDGEVYFDHLVRGKPEQSTNQNAPVAESVYFDHLVEGPPPTGPPPTGPPPTGPPPPGPRSTASIPGSVRPLPVLPGQDRPLPTPPSSERPPAELPQDSVYFDHLVEPSPTKPKNSPVKPKWPPENAESAAPPPVPMKKRTTIRKGSEVSIEPERPIKEERPVPRPRGNTLKRAEPESLPPRPPKPVTSPTGPGLPPKPRPKISEGEGVKAPPIPSKPGPAWRK